MTNTSFIRSRSQATVFCGSWCSLDCPRQTRINQTRFVSLITKFHKPPGQQTLEEIVKSRLTKGCKVYCVCWSAIVLDGRRFRDQLEETIVHLLCWICCL